MKITHEEHINCRIMIFVHDMNETGKKTMWSVKFHDFQKHNITWDTMQWRCREDVISRRTAWFARTRNLQKKTHIIPEHDDLNHVICDLDGTDGHDTKYEIRFSQITVNFSSSEKLTWRSIWKQILCLLWDIIIARFSIFLRHVRMFFHQISWHQSHSQNQKMNLQKKWIIIFPQIFIGWNRKDLDIQRHLDKSLSKKSAFLQKVHSNLIEWSRILKKKGYELHWNVKLSIPHDRWQFVCTMKESSGEI